VLQFEVSHLQGARRAELEIDRWGGHPGTTNKQLRINGNAWLALPELRTTPEGHDAVCYMSQDLPVVAIPLEHLRSGMNTLEGTAGDQICKGFGWGQWGWYGATLRVYYAPASKAAARIAPLRTVGENPSIRVQAPGDTERVEVLAWYEGIDEDGDGEFASWHPVGSVTAAPFTVRWDTTWVPDQPRGSVRLVARVRRSDGTWTVTPVLDGVTLARKSGSVRLYRPLDVPEKFWTRAKRRVASRVEMDTLKGATEAVLVLRTWNGHNENVLVNGTALPIGGLDHKYAQTAVKAPVSALREGSNAIEFYSETEHHGVEILWPGPMLLVRYGELQ
jgi:hypothetical protein